jgi:hypothetical protein
VGTVISCGFGATMKHREITVLARADEVIE